MKKRFAAIFIITGLLLSFACQVRGNATVDWDFDNGFSPNTVVIAPGETVTWRNFDQYHANASVSIDNLISFSLPYNSSHGVIFNVPAGTYGYHSDWGDNGAVIVNVPPSVTITNPLNNAVFPAPATFTIQATATDTADDSVSDVQFFLGTSDGTNSIEDVFSEPFSTTVTDLAAGNYTLIAVATDSRGAQATNAITITVGGGAGIYLNAPRMAAGQFLFDVTGLTAGKTNVLQTSTNLVSWQPAKTNIAADASMTVTNARASGSHFYRVLQLP